MSDTPTPRTDAELRRIENDCAIPIYLKAEALKPFARQLERELNEAKRELDAIREHLWPNQTGLPNEFRNALLAIQARETLLIAQRDSLRAINAELEEALKYPRHGDTGKLLERAADNIDALVAQKDSDSSSYLSPHLRNAADRITSALTKSKESRKD